MPFGGIENLKGVLWVIYTPLFPKIALNLYGASWTLVVLIESEIIKSQTSLKGTGF